MRAGEGWSWGVCVVTSTFFNRSVVVKLSVVAGDLTGSLVVTGSLTGSLVV